MATIKQLQSALNKNQLERISLENKIDDLQKRHELPGLRKKYAGKYFRYKNCSGPGDCWHIYVFCVRVISVHRAICERFERNNEGEWTFHTNHETGLYLFQEQISQKQFDKAAIEFLSAAQAIMQLK